MSKYFVLGYQMAIHPCRDVDSSSINRLGVWWNDGTLLNLPANTIIRGTLKSYEELNPDQSPRLASLYLESTPFFRDELVEALENFGVNNLEKYPAEITDPDNGRVHTNYKAVNIIGMVAAADMQKSEAIIHDGIPLVDVSFDSLVIDKKKAADQLIFRLAENNSAIVIHDRLKNAIEAAGITDLTFYDPGLIAL